MTSWHDYPRSIIGRAENSLLDWFARNVNLGETWLDVGANYGYTAIALSQLVGPLGRVYAFEPMLSTAGYLSQSRHLNNFLHLMVIPFALGASEGMEVKHLPVVRGMVDSTLQEEQWTEKILVASLDFLYPQICGNQPQVDGIKIDVQGMEIETLQGMSETLRTFKPKLVVEIHRGVDRNCLLDLIEAVGYRRQAVPIEPMPGEIDAKLVDDRSYVFRAL
jgi:FkbM family methyltransferase